jgi:hypothetical protein
MAENRKTEPGTRFFKVITKVSVRVTGTMLREGYDPPISRSLKA